MKSAALSAVRWTSMSTAVRAALQVAQITVFARWIAADQLGLIAMVAAVTSLVQIFSDMGVSMAIMQRTRISHEELSSLYWFSLAVGVALGLVLATLSPLIAGVYRDDRLLPLILALSPVPLVVAAGQQFKVLAEKSLDFSTVSRIDLVSAVLAFVATAVVAIAGGGAYAVVTSIAVSALVTSVLACAVLGRGKRPGRVFKLDRIRSFLSFGGYTVANNIVATLNQQLDVFLGGRLLGAQALGVYNIPREFCLRIAMLINPIATRVGLPLMVKAQDDVDLLRKVYLTTLRMTASTNFPIYVFLFGFADQVVPLLLGARWLPAVPLMRVLALWGLFRSITNPAGSLLFGTGNARRAMLWNLACLAAAAPVLWMTGHHSALALAYGQLALAVVVSLAGWRFLVEPLCRASFTAYWMQVIPALTSALIALAASDLLAAPIFDGWPRLAARAIAFAVVYLGASSVLNRQWLNLMLELLGRRRQ
jgi:O-antigen/teichoic acid export membrane protein